MPHPNEDGLKRAKRALENAHEEQRQDGEVMKRADAVQEALSRSRRDNYWALKVSALFKGQL